MPIPTDSLLSQAERRAKMAAEQAQRADERRIAEAQRLVREQEENAKARVEEDKFIEKQMSLIADGETREHLIERIREMRAEPAAAPATMPITERMRKQLEEEQEAGRQVVARNQAERDALQAARLKAEREDAERQGTLAPVYHPNPTMGEKFPVNKASIK